MPFLIVGEARSGTNLLASYLKSIENVSIGGEILSEKAYHGIRRSFVTRRAVLRHDVFPLGHKNLKVGYRYGLDRPPADLKRAVVKAVEARRAGDTSGIPSRAISVQGTELGNVVLATPGLGKWITAIPEIDEVINRYRRRDLGVGIS